MMMTGLVFSESYYPYPHYYISHHEDNNNMKAYYAAPPPFWAVRAKNPTLIHIMCISTLLSWVHTFGACRLRSKVGDVLCIQKNCCDVWSGSKRKKLFNVVASNVFYWERKQVVDFGLQWKSGQWRVAERDRNWRGLRHWQLRKIFRCFMR